MSIDTPYTTTNPTIGGEYGPEAKIDVGPISFDDSSAKYQEVGGDGTFADYHVVNRYEKDRHTYMMGVTSPNGFRGASVAFVQLASPTLVWVADWTACKAGAKPNIPDPTPADGDWVLLDDWWEPHMVTVAPDGVTPIYRISGTYIYGKLNPQSSTIDDISFPRPPWLQDSFSRNVEQGLLQQGLTNNGAVGSNLNRVNPGLSTGGDLSRTK